MNRILLLLLWFFTFSTAFSQDKVLDSLMLQLKNAKSTLEQTKATNAVSNQYKYSDPIKMAEYANKALALAKKNSFTTEEGNAYLNLGNSNIILGDYKKALDYFVLAKNLFEETTKLDKNDKDSNAGLAKAYGSMGVVFSEQSNYGKALQYYLKSVKAYEELKDEVQCAKIYNNIGVVYKSQKIEEKALVYFLKAQEIQEKRNDPNIGIIRTNIANSYLKQKNLDKAAEYYALAKNSLDKNPNPRALGEWYNNMGLFYKEKNQPNEAIEQWKLALVTFQSIEDKFGLADTYFLLGQLYYDQKNYEEALKMAEKSFDLATEIDVLEQKVMTQKLLSAIYDKKGNTKLAFDYFQKYSEAKDSLINAENIRKSVEAALNYEFEKKEVLQKEENEKKELVSKEEAKIFKYKLLFGSLITLLLFGIGFLIYNRAQLKKNLTLQKELAEYEQKALHLQMNPHFVFNCLGSISSFIVSNSTEAAIKYLAKFSKLMRLTLEYSKESLIPVDKEIESLQNYLELEQLRFNQKFEFTITKTEDVEDDMAIPPLLLQPLVENAIIHGIVPKKELGNIAIAFKVENNHLKCTIADNGIGLSASKAMKANSVSVHKSMAIDIIHQRLEKIASTTGQKANMNIEEIIKDNQSAGSQVILCLPIQYVKQ